MEPYQKNICVQLGHCARHVSFSGFRQTGIRIIEIEDFDFSPCGGTHCSATGEIGIVRISRCEPHKGGLRVHFLCGQRAFADYRQKAAILKTLTVELSTAETALPDIIRKNRQQLEDLRRKNDGLKKQLIKHEAQALVESSVKIGNVRIVKNIFQNRDPKEMKLLAKAISGDVPDIVILFGLRTAGKATLYFRRSENLAVDMSGLMHETCKIINGSGGGRPQAAQGGGSAGEKIEEALNGAMDRITKFYSKASRNPQ